MRDAYADFGLNISNPFCREINQNQPEKMPRKRNKRPRKEKEKPIAGGALADCVFPEDIMLGILTRLPLRSIVRFKSVCKPWRELLSTTEFVKMHKGEFSSDPKNESVIFYEANTSSMYVLNIMESTGKKKPTAILDRLFPETQCLNIVGCCNGLICLGSRGSEQRIILWNPALKLYKFIRAPKVDFVDPDFVSLGFGYDANVDDFKVARIVYVPHEGPEMDISGAQLYSANSDSWTTVELGFQSRVFRPFGDLIVNGNLYWGSNISYKDEVEALVCFDVRKMIFKILPLPEIDLDHIDGRAELVDWKGNLCTLWCSDDKSGMFTTFGVWVLDVGEGIWRKIHTLGPIQGSVDMFTVCLKNGKLVGKLSNGKLIVFDPDNGFVEEIVIEGGQIRPFEIYGYTESLIQVKGMVKEAEERVGFEEKYH